MCGKERREDEHTGTKGKVENIGGKEKFLTAVNYLLLVISLNLRMK